jgi:hypothetical protein
MRSIIRTNEARFSGMIFHSGPCVRPFIASLKACYLYTGVDNSMRGSAAGAGIQISRHRRCHLKSNINHRLKTEAVWKVLLYPVLLGFRNNTAVWNTGAPKRKLKKTHFVDAILSRVLHYLRFSLNLPLKSADDWYTGTLKNINKTDKYVDYFPFRLILIFPVT